MIQKRRGDFGLVSRRQVGLTIGSRTMGAVAPIAMCLQRLSPLSKCQGLEYSLLLRLGSTYHLASIQEPFRVKDFKFSAFETRYSD